MIHPSLTHLTRHFSRRSNADGDDTPEDEETYKSYGRHLARTCGPFERMLVIAEHGVREALREEDGEQPERNSQYVSSL